VALCFHPVHGILNVCTDLLLYTSWPALAEQSQDTHAEPSPGAVRKLRKAVGKARTVQTRDLSAVLLDPLHDTGVPAVAIAAGERHTVVVTAKGAVLVFGDAAGGQLALGDWELQREPVWVDTMKIMPVMVTATSRYIM